MNRLKNAFPPTDGPECAHDDDLNDHDEPVDDVGMECTSGPVTQNAKVPHFGFDHKCNDVALILRRHLDTKSFPPKVDLCVLG